VDFLNRILQIHNIIRPALDVLILTFLLYKTYEFLVKTRAIQLVKGASWLALVFGVAYIFKLETLQWLLNLLAPGALVALAIVFQPEMRKIITKLGLTEIFKPDKVPDLGQLESTITASEILSGMRRGMLIVFPRRTDVKDILETGTRINGEISSTMIGTVFQFDGPLHDGAMVIQNGRIEAAGCFLPLSEQQDIKKSFGTRHRAALGMSEQSDAVVLVVSEETGAISIATDGKLLYDLSPAEIQKKLRALLDKSNMKKSMDEDELNGSGDTNTAGILAAETSTEAKELFFEE
jgi:diadenylate cyclase